MFEKRGQATIYIVVIAVLVLAVFIMMYFQGEVKGSFRGATEKELTIEDRNVAAYIQSCLDLTAKNGLFFLGFVGGRLNPDPFGLYYHYDESYKVAYFYIEGKNNIPVPYQEAYWTGLLDRYMKNYFEGCIGNFQSFPISVVKGKFSSKTSFTDESVIFNIQYPVTINRDGKKVELDPKYTATVPVRLREMLFVASTIVEKEVSNDQFIHWDYLTQVTQKQYNITAYTEEEDTIVYRMIDLRNKIDNEPYIMQFANKVR